MRWASVTTSESCWDKDSRRFFSYRKPSRKTEARGVQVHCRDPEEHSRAFIGCNKKEETRKAERSHRCML